MSIVLEACVGCYEDAKKAVERGANRIELCDNLKEGGTTPSYGTINLACKNFDIPVAVIIRPRGGNFVYSDDEFEIMKKDIEICRELGAYAVVFGILTKDNKIDIKVTFHMAFDEIENKVEAIETLIDLGVDRILTKGCKTSALDGKDILKNLVQISNGRIEILIGGSVTKNNYKELVEYIGCNEAHGSRIV